MKSQGITREQPVLSPGYCPPLSNSWIMNLIWLYIALNMTPSIDCYWVEAVPKLSHKKYDSV